MTRTGRHQRCISAIHWLEACGALALGPMLTAVIGTPAAQAQTYTCTVLYRFKGYPTDGASPGAGLIRDPAGNFYGSTPAGGDSTNCFPGCGVVFKLDSTGETVLYNFKGTSTSGANPQAGLIRDSAGNLYGTTYNGGTCCGVIFKMDTTGAETVLYSFKGGADGAFPEAGLIRDSAVNLYGTTLAGGGVSGAGVVFKLDTTGTQTVLHRFKGLDGANPQAGVIGDSAGNLYGTTQYGGASNYGVVFKVDTTGVETVLYGFTGGRTGQTPWQV
jgi:uncharacterized repeat protein (TIGR03803 family)